MTVFLLRNLLCAVTVLGLLLSASEAEARFGKRSKGEKTHESSAVGDDDDDDDDDHGSGSSGGDAASTVNSIANLLFFIADVASTPSQDVASSSATAEVQAAPSQGASGHLRLGVDGSTLGGGTGANLFLAIEGRRMGLDGRLTLLSLPTDDGTQGSDELSVGSVHLTYALVAHDRFRLRMEGGVSLATAPDLATAGPSFGLSFDACLGGPFDIELRAQVTPFPYRQLDAQAGLALHLNVVVLRGGWRGLYLDDAGLVDGVAHQDALSGPYLGLGLTF
ncbi:hypothetical protein POL68_29420 [Stigmatella sp. ncwal1]|uniref:Outer membrane protein beta-barrel domain-containing protein n=1 Tax=Stigmatella ashevillensis TaxID=2995309 RepID=A0ABT5DG21_9BACT|nr:hypothetical protein [Stigmatella ashevillena]MDC0712620.1 hypothetical protein [Stigmatella ashevillena]